MPKRQPPPTRELRKIPIKRLFFVMKHIAEEDRWTEYAVALARAGHTDFIMDLDTVEAVKGVVRKRVPRKVAKATKGKTRGRRIEDSASCGSGWGGHPTPPPKPPPRPDPPDGGGGGGGPPRPDPPDGGGGGPPTPPDGGGGGGRPRKKNPKAGPRKNPPRDKRKPAKKKAPNR